jgi:AraC-like DNA-binding protein
MGILLEHLVTAPVAALHLPVSEHPKIAFIANALTRNPGDRTTLAQWANIMAMSERTLARLVKQETGLTFGRWRQQLHLLIALRLLASGASVQQVSGELGYDTAAAFTVMFRKALGKPPTQYFSDLEVNKK